MIQRIQSVYLLLTALLGFYAIFSAMAHFYPGFDINLDFSKLFSASQIKSTIFGLFVKLGAFLAAIAIFLFKNRTNQKRCIQISSAFILLSILFGIYCFIVVPIPSAVKSIGSYIGNHFTLITPLLMLLFNWLAIKAINSDEDLIRSADRLR